MNHNFSPGHPANNGPVHRDDGQAGSRKRAGQGKTRRRNSRSAAEARNGPHAGPPPAPLRVTIHPFHGPAAGVDVTDALVGAVALVLWKLQGGNEPVNRLEAIVLLERAMRGCVTERKPSGAF